MTYFAIAEKLKKNLCLKKMREKEKRNGAERRNYRD